MVAFDGALNAPGAILVCEAELDAESPVATGCEQAVTAITSNGKACSNERQRPSAA
ncbi:MAG TPA: hypothetical protein VHM70_10925 [Polyangiaceae bacterium]|jgi:hypothetical protein|nr:hypothetical protein [Polyangiaceae bacterium]